MQELSAFVRNINGVMSDTAVALEPLPSLFLRRAPLEDLPPLDLPPGFTIRPATEQDIAGVSQVLAKAFPDRDWSPERTHEHLWDDLTVRTVFLIERYADALIVATASARVMPDFPDAGYVHWVGVAPDFRDLWLGRYVTLATLYEFARLGLSAAVLETDDFRIAALRLYARIGFRPEMRHPSHAARWDKIFTEQPFLKTLMEQTV